MELRLEIWGHACDEPQVVDIWAVYCLERGNDDTGYLPADGKGDCGTFSSHC